MDLQSNEQRIAGTPDASEKARVVSREFPLHHYQWGNRCDGWTLADESSLSVKAERMPAGTSEALHYHQFAQQFFFILKGVATFDIEGISYTVLEGQGIHIKSGFHHRILNEGKQDLEFILFSSPSTNQDRIIAE